MLVKKKLLGEFKIGRTIGEGAFSKVKLATHRITNEKVAIKIIKKEEDKDSKEPKKESSVPSILSSSLSQLSKEVRLLMRLDHPNVIKLHQVIDTTQELYIVMEYASGGELIDYIAAKGYLNEKEGRRLFRQLVSAIDHCHLAGVIHRDLKLENLLLSTEKNLLLSDFGLGRTINGDDHYLNTFCGTPLYAGPELVSGIKYIGPSADIWSMGIVLYIMTAGRPPFKCETISELYQQIKGVKYTCPNTFTQELKDLIGKMLVRDPQKRVKMDDLRKDEWLNKGEEEPPIRIMPKLTVAEGSSVTTDFDAMEQLLTGVETHEDYTAYYFGKTVDIFDLVGNRDSSPLSPSGTLASQASAPPRIQVESPRPSFESPLSGDSKISNRSGSITSGISRFNPFGTRKVDVAPPVRQRAASVAPGNPTYDAAKSKAQKSASQEPAMDMLNLNHGRRHSVAIGVPNTISPNSTLTRGERRISSNSSSRDEGSLNSSTASQSVSKQSGNGSHRKSHEISPGDQKKIISLNVPGGIANRSAAPSMDQISENEEYAPSTKASIQTNGGSNATQQQPSSKSKTTEDHRRRPSVIEAMGFHTQSGYTDEMRSVRYSTNLHTTTIYSPSEIMAQVENLIGNKRFFPGISVEKRGKYVWVCQHVVKNAKITFEVEVVRVWLLRMSAIKVKRLGGDALSFKETFEQIVSGLGW